MRGGAHIVIEQARTAVPFLSWKIPDPKQDEPQMNEVEGAMLGVILEGIKKTTEKAAENLKNTLATNELKARGNGGRFFLEVCTRTCSGLTLRTLSRSSEIG